MLRSTAEVADPDTAASPAAAADHAACGVESAELRARPAVGALVRCRHNAVTIGARLGALLAPAMRVRTSACCVEAVAAELTGQLGNDVRATDLSPPWCRCSARAGRSRSRTGSVVEVGRKKNGPRVVVRRDGPCGKSIDRRPYAAARVWYGEADRLSWMRSQTASR